MKKLIATNISLLLFLFGISQQMGKEFQYIDTNLFQDNAHHWYDILERDAVIKPKQNQPKYTAVQLIEVANNVLLYQKNNGGWPKNYDIMAILLSVLV